MGDVNTPCRLLTRTCENRKGSWAWGARLSMARPLGGHPLQDDGIGSGAVSTLGGHLDRVTLERRLKRGQVIALGVKVG